MPTCNGRSYCVVAMLLLAWASAVLVRQPPSPPLTRQIRFNPPQLDLGAIPRMAPTASKVNPDPLTCPLQGFTPLHSTPLITEITKLWLTAFSSSE